MNYREPLFRPPAEADSLIFQVAYGCPHNACRFCGMYKGIKYLERDIDEIKKEIENASRLFPETRRIFLADGDVMHLHFDTLIEILSYLNKAFPQLSRISLYANGSSILKKTKSDLCELRKNKLHTLYVGLESGDEELLKLVQKNETAEKMIEAVRISQECGLRASVMILLGLAGKNGWEKHAVKTAEALNRMQPRLLSALRFIEIPGLKMFDGYESSTELSVICEFRKIIENLELDGTIFRSDHVSNPLVLEGRFPKDKARFLWAIDAEIASGKLDSKGKGRLPLWL